MTLYVTILGKKDYLIKFVKMVITMTYNQRHFGQSHMEIRLIVNNIPQIIKRELTQFIMKS